MAPPPSPGCARHDRVVQTTPLGTLGGFERSIPRLEALQDCWSRTRNASSAMTSHVLRQRAEVVGLCPNPGWIAAVIDNRPCAPQGSTTVR